MIPSLDTLSSQFSLRGYVDPIRLCGSKECDGWLQQLHAQPSPAEWMKGSAVTSRCFYDLAVDFRITRLLAECLGDEMILWGASLVKREPGQAHPWHSDIESSSPEGRFASVWIALQNTAAGSSLTLMPGSHRFGKTVQECAAHRGMKRNDITHEHIAAWAQDFDAADAPELVPMQDGEMLIFDGRMWHSSLNVSENLRTAILLQYASTDTPVRMPDFRQLEWPFRYHDSPRPPCVRIKGSSSTSANRIVAPPLLPSAGNPRRLNSLTWNMPLPLEGDAQGERRSYPAFRGFTAGLADLSCHVSVLGQGKCPHPPHQHPEEEILLVLAGEADLTLPDLKGWGAEETVRLRAREFAYYPAGFHHTLTAASVEPLQYLMIKWYGSPVQEKPPLGHQIFELVTPHARDAAPEVNGYQARVLFESATVWLPKIQCHLSTLAPGGGYAPHADEYDVILVVLEGEVETLGERVPPLGVICYAAGEPHGIHNSGSVTAVYLVFELHGSAQSILQLREEALGKEEREAQQQSLLQKEGERYRALDRNYRALKKEHTRLEKTERARLKEEKRAASRKLNWYEKLTSTERWKRRWNRWTGRS